MAPTIHARSEWTSRAPTGSTPIKPGSINIVDVHWPATKGKIARDQASIAKALRGWQAYHMDTKGWRDIAYNIGVDLSGDVWILRGWDVQDGGVAGRSDDVTILAILGDQDTVTDAMKHSILWAMAEFDRRRRRTLRRTHHGALVSTTCPGPTLTAWSKAGFPPPAPTTTTTPQEDFLMALTDTEQRRILEAANRIMGMMVQRYDAKGNPARVLDSEDGDYLRILLESVGAKLGVDIASVSARLDAQSATILAAAKSLQEAAAGLSGDKAALIREIADSLVVAARPDGMQA